MKKNIIFPKDITLGPINRTLGRAGSREMLGAGFMHKPNKLKDHVDYTPHFYSLVYVIRGRGEYHDALGRIYPVKAGDYFQRIPGFSHTTYLDPTEDWWECFLDFGPSLSQALINMNLIQPECPVGHVGLRQEWIDSFLLILEEITHAPDHAIPALLPKMLDLHQRILNQGQEMAEDRAARDMVRKGCLLLSKDLKQRIDLKTMCRAQGWGYERFRKTFQAAIGIPPGHYRIRCRIDAARRLLHTEENASVSHIAELLGYANPYEFSAQFKKNTGMSPRAFSRRK